MPSTLHVILCAAAATLFWTCLGGATGRLLRLDRALVWPLAPGLGWAVHSAVALPVFLLLGFSRASVFALAAVSLLASLLVLRLAPPARDQDEAGAGVPLLAVIGAALIALAPAAAILPKFAADGIVLAPPIFDHSKVAIVDEIARLGLPPGNPFFGEAAEPSRLAYYYLWHFAAAELARLTGITGWEADAAQTWFAAFASLTLMLALATWFTGRRAAALLVLPLVLAASARPVLAAVLGPETVGRLVWDATGFAGWLFQSAWVPQHLTSATCVVLAIFLIARSRARPSALLAVVLALVVAAAFGSSTWVGGLTFALAAPAAALALVLGAEPHRRLPFLLCLAGAAVLALALAAPLLHDEIAASTIRGGTPVRLAFYPVLATAFPEGLRRALDLPAYWLVLLVIEFPAIYLAGAIALVGFLRTHRFKEERLRAARAFAALAAVSLVVAWLFVSVIGNNNDLAWRAVLPGVTVLTVFAALGLAHWLAARAWLPAGVALAALAIGLPDGVRLVREYVAAPFAPADRDFAATTQLWEAVRRHAAPDERVGNNPLFFEHATPWPINISWALLADRRSCFAGKEYAMVFTPLSRGRDEAIDAQFSRVFAGAGFPADLRDMAVRYGCHVVVLTPRDGAWEHDPFAESPYYRLVETQANAWRIYRADGIGAPPGVPAPER